MARTRFDFQTIRSDGALLATDLLRRVVDPKAALPGTKPEDYGLAPREHLNEVITRSWNLLRRHWADFRSAAKQLPSGEPGTNLTNDKWSLPLLRELGFVFLQPSAGAEVDDPAYPISRFSAQTTVHLVGCNLSLDRRTPGVRRAAAATPHGHVQNFLNRSDKHMWALLSNGLQLRILRDNKASSRQSFLEFDLESMLAGEVYSDFTVLWLTAHATRFAPLDGEKPESCWLEQWNRIATEQGALALGDLRAGVERALQALGQGLVGHPKNVSLRESLRSGVLSLPAFHGELMRVVYRLIFLFVAEDRTFDGLPLLHPHDDSDAGRLARARYLDHDSVSRLRELASKIRGSHHCDLWHQFNLLIGAVSGDFRFDTARRNLALPILGGYLWSSSSTPHLNAPKLGDHAGSELTNADFLRTIRNLAFTPEGQTLRPVNYKNLGSEKLGRVYESLLALTPQISGDGAKFTFAEFGGNERTISGSYYTPDSLVQCLLDSALDPIVADAIRDKTGVEAEMAILNLRVCDPACGSGHFLVGAAHRLAHHLARARAHTQGEGQPSPLMHQHALREVIRRCVYGVDLNPMAVELCKVSLWMESMEPGRPLTFLDAHIKCGNSLLGTTPKLMEAGIPDEAFKPLSGDDKKRVTYYKKRNKQEKKHRTSEPETLASAAIRETPFENARFLADAWCAAFVWRMHDTDLPRVPIGFTGECDAITERVYRTIEHHPHSVQPWIRDRVQRLAAEYQFFHWHLEFPEVFGEREALPAGRDSCQCCDRRSDPSMSGFNIILGNPPFLNQQQTATATQRCIAALIRLRAGGQRRMGTEAIRGYTDLSATFLLFSTTITRSGGRVAMVQPQSLLATGDAAPVRRALLDVASLESLWVSNEQVFEDVGVLTCAPTLHVGGPRKSTLQRSTTAHFTPLPTINLDNDALAREDTWSHLNAAASGIPEFSISSAGTLGDIAEATADFRDQYYGLHGFLIEDAALSPNKRADFAAFPPIVTTGLIDLAQCRWGSACCRILRAKWLAPRIDRRRMEVEGTLGPWIATRLVPKLLIATQTRVIEVFADEHARYVPSVPVLTVIPADPAMLWKLAAALASPVCSAMAMRKYAGVALSVDAIKLSAKQVLTMPLPTDQVAWEDAAAYFKVASDSEHLSDRANTLRAYGYAACAAFGFGHADVQSLMEWWLNRLHFNPESGDDADRA